MSAVKQFIRNKQTNKQHKSQVVAGAISKISKTVAGNLNAGKWETADLNNYTSLCHFVYPFDESARTNTLKPHLVGLAFMY